MTWYCVTSAIYDDGRMTAAITAIIEADKKPAATETSTSRKDIYKDWFDSRAAADEWIAEIKKEG